MGLSPSQPEGKDDLLPDDWERRPVGRFAKIITGPFGTLLKAAEYSTNGDGVPVISVGEIREGFFRVGSHTPRVNDTVTRRLQQFVLRKGDVVFGRKGSVDRSALVGEKEAGWFLGSDGISVRPNGGLDASYLSYQFQGAAVRDWLNQHATGTTMATLNQRILGAVTVPIPATTAEQEAIAEALSDADALIESLEQLIAKKRLIKQGVMQELLTGKRRLPGFEGEWREVPLGDLTSMGSGGTPSSKIGGYYGGKIPWVSISDMTSGERLLWETARHLTDAGIANSAAVVFPAGTVLYAMYASLGECRVAGKPMCSSQAILGIQTTTAITVDFLYYHLTYIKPQVKLMGQQGTQANLNKGMVQDFSLMLPSPTEQTAITAILSDIDDELDALEKQLSKARQLKQGMMQQLLTGRIRLV